METIWKQCVNNFKALKIKKKFEVFKKLSKNFRRILEKMWISKSVFKKIFKAQKNSGKCLKNS